MIDNFEKGLKYITIFRLNAMIMKMKSPKEIQENAELMIQQGKQCAEEDTYRTNMLIYAGQAGNRRDATQTN